MMESASIIEPTTSNDNELNLINTLDAKVHDLQQRFEQLQLPDDDNLNNELSADIFNSPNANDIEKDKDFAKGGAFSPIGRMIKNTNPSFRQSLRKLTASDNITNNHDNNNRLDISKRLINNTNELPSNIENSVDELNELKNYWDNFKIPDEIIISPNDITLQEFDNITLPSIDNEFKVESNDITLAINRVPVEIITKQKRELESTLINERNHIVDTIKKKEIDLIWREHLARQRIKQQDEERKEKLLKDKKLMITESLDIQMNLLNNFKSVRENIEHYIKSYNYYVRDKFGDLIYQDNSLGRTLEIHSSNLPQPIEIHVHFLRAIKSKLPKGAYVIMLSQHESLGGRPLWWSKIGPYGIGSKYPCITKPCKHYGRYFDRIMQFESSCYTLCPSRLQLKPSFCLVIELFQLSNRHNPIDRCVAWTAVPMCNEHFGLVTGKLKLPLLRGEHSPNVHLYSQMEEAIGSDLNNWLCNIYIEILPLPVDVLNDYMDMTTKKIKFDYLNKSIDTNIKINEFSKILHSKVDSNIDSIIDSNVDNKTIKSLTMDKGLYRRAYNNSRNNYIDNKIDNKFDNKADSKSKIDSKLDSKLDNKKTSYTLSTIWISIYNNLFHKKTSSIRPNNPEDFPLLDHSNDVEMGADRADNDEQQQILERGYFQDDEFFLTDEQKGKLVGVDALTSEVDRHWVDSSVDKPVVRRLQTEGPRLDSEAIDVTNENIDNSKYPAKLNHNSSKYTTDSSKRYTGWKVLEDSRDIELFTMAVASDPSQRRRLLPKQIQKSKIRFISLELFGDIAPYMWGTFDFYITILVFVVAIWLRIYVHYLAQYLYLLGVPTPVYDFHLGILQIQLKYMSKAIGDGTEVGVVAIGPIANIIIFLFLGISGKLFYKIAKFLPENVSKFIACYGFVSLIDPLLVLLIDISYHNYDCSNASIQCQDSYTKSNCMCYEGDFIKLYNRYARLQGSGITGVIVTLMIYLGTMTISSLLLYEYIVYIHKDARIIDLYRRINAPNEEFFLPDDYEITADELNSICSNALRFRSIDGSTRKVYIYNYTNNQQVNNAVYSQLYSHESIQHCVIYDNNTEKQTNRIYRHFILLSNGVILEIFQQFYHKGSKYEAYIIDEKIKNTIDNILTNKIDHNIDNNIDSNIDNNIVDNKPVDSLFSGFDKS